MQIFSHIKTPPHPFENRIGSYIINSVGRLPHLHTGKDQECGEYIEHPAELLDQGRANADHDRAKHNDAEDTPEKHTMLIKSRHSEIGEYHRDDEDIVHRQRFLDHEAGDILHPRHLAHVPPDPATESEAEANVNRAQDQAFADRNLALLAVQHTEIQRQ